MFKERFAKVHYPPLRPPFLNHCTMKQLFITVIAFLLIFSDAQSKDTRLSYRLAVLLQKEADQSKEISVLIKGNVPQIREMIQSYGGTFKYAAGPVCSVKIPLSTLRILSEANAVERMEEGTLQLKQLNDRMLINNKIDLVHNGAAPLTQGYDGTGVIMGIIDTGIDFLHPDFQDSLGKTRIQWIWDHNLPNAANTPTVYGYGQEFSKINIDSGQASAHVDLTAHGTHVAGIAAGNGRSGVAFTGACPAADIIAVSLNFNLNDDAWLSSVADAVNYIFTKADSTGQPCVINISAGTYFGTHDGTDLNSQLIDNMITAAPSRVVVAAAGNAGNFALHVQHHPVADTAFTFFAASSASLYIECIGNVADMNGLNFSVGNHTSAPNVTDRGFSAWHNVASTVGILTNDSIMNANGDRLARIQRYATLIGGTYDLMYMIIPDSAGYWFSINSAGTGMFNIWSFDMISAGLPVDTVYPAIVKYASPDFDQTICSSFQCSDKVITVGQYINRNNYIDVNGNVQTFATVEGALGASSSHGPTRDNRIKPDITSTGEQTLSCLRTQSWAWFLANQPYKLAQGGMHIRDGGTSSAAPAIAGIAALYLQKYPTATSAVVKDHILYCAVQDSFTGTALPDNYWGYGKADALAALSNCAITGVNTVHVNTELHVYPNPALNSITVSGMKNAGYIDVYNNTGSLVRRVNVQGGDGSVIIQRNGLPAGLYLLRSEDGLSSARVVFE